MKEPIYPNRIVTIVIRDVAPMLCINESPVYRSVQIEFTEEQIKKLALEHTGVNCGTDIYENISMMFIEPKIKPVPARGEE